MKKSILISLFLYLLCSIPLPAVEKPVTGTWLNLVWQDERNNYMNPPGSDNTDPELWRTKVEELNAMGMDCLVIMAVANEEKAFYPSSIMPAAYPEGRKSPVDAIMETAGRLGMKVFLSCGWARNQLDDLTDAFVIERQQEIMRELVALYADSPAFYGWYLPVESSFEPVLPEHAVKGVNRLSAMARSMTPDKMVMISPYGICYADIDNPLFEERIAQLDVDIIAYQDEVGCVRESQPLPRMKEHFRKLGEIHSRTGIAFWANIESFTWDRGTNSWYSTLVPAAFGRYLSQLVAVNQAGVEKVLSFAIFGIYDNPSSPRPLGQSSVSNEAYRNYMAWKNGDPHWKLLEHIFSSDVRSDKVFATDEGGLKLADGEFGHESTRDGSWVRFPDGKMTTTLKCGENDRISTVAARFLNYRIDSVSMPESVTFSISKDGSNWHRSKTVAIPAFPNDLHDCWSDIATVDFKGAKARYIKIEAVAPEGKSLMCDEILVNPISCLSGNVSSSVDLTLVPPGEITDKVDLDIRGGIVNRLDGTERFKASLIVRKGLYRKVLAKETLTLDAGTPCVLRTVMPTKGRKGDYDIIFKVKNNGKTTREIRTVKVCPSNQRSTAKIAGAWTGLYCWSELEGKHWNPDIKRLTADDWRAVIRSMHEVGMDIVVIQELFRNEQYCGRHGTTPGNYNGLAFYPSELYPGRMETACDDPLEAIMSEADKLGMQVFPGIGLFAWFDFTKESLQWHKQVASEVWKRYGHHPSFYGFYVSEESGGSLDNWEWDPDLREIRKGEIVRFFRELDEWCEHLAPGKPVMLATNSFDVPGAADTYRKLCANLDILCPFGFARMPEGDITGKEAADFLQEICDLSGCHFWFDLEAFLFYPDGSLYPRDFDGIMTDLTMFGNFEKILCYQYPGVFNNPDMHPQIGEDKGIELYSKYKTYYNSK